MQNQTQKLEATCSLYNRAETLISGPHNAFVSLWLTDGPLNTYWYGVAEIAATDNELCEWVFGDDPQDNYIDFQFDDGRGGLAKQIVCKRVADIFQVSFFGQSAWDS